MSEIDHDHKEQFHALVERGPAIFECPCCSLVWKKTTDPNHPKTYLCNVDEDINSRCENVSVILTVDDHSTCIEELKKIVKQST